MGSEGPVYKKKIYRTEKQVGLYRSFCKQEMWEVFRIKKGSSLENTGSFDLSPCLEQGEGVVLNKSDLCI